MNYRINGRPKKWAKKHRFGWSRRLGPSDYPLSFFCPGHQQFLLDRVAKNPELAPILLLGS